MKNLIVRYRYGETEFCYYNASYSMVQQVLDMIVNDLKKIVGTYKWYIEGTAGQYRIVAVDERGQRFTESIGKSPSKALYNYLPAKKILADKYKIFAGGVN